MKPSKTSAAALAGAAARSRTELDKREIKFTRATAEEQAKRPFVVFVRAFGRPRHWARYSTASEAAAQIIKLRNHGFDSIAIDAREARK